MRILFDNNCFNRASQHVFFTKHGENDQVNQDEIGRECSTHGETRDAYRILVGKPEGKSPLRRPRLGGTIILSGLIWLRIGNSGGLL
jgi:hypothetical protein